MMKAIGIMEHMESLGRDYVNEREMKPTFPIDVLIKNCLTFH